MDAKIPLQKIRIQKPQLPQGRWAVFTAAPHRVMFAAGFAGLMLNMLWWTIELSGRYTGWWEPLHLTVHTTWIHAFLMVYGVFPFFIFGFLFTVYPRWMRTPVIRRQGYVAAFGLLFGGMLLIYAGVFSHVFVLAAGLALFLAGWGVSLYVLLRSYLQAQSEDTRYETLFNTALAAGWFGVALYLLSILTAQWMLIHYTVQIGLWLFLLPITVGVAHRMVPFFTSAVIKDYPVYRPMWLLWLVPLCGLGHTVTAVMAQWQWRWIFDLPLMLAAFYLSFRWNLKRSMAERMAAVLHIAFLWLGISLALYNLQSLWLLFSGELILGKAPLHALTVGFMTALLVAMVSRVVLGHSGRIPQADKLTWLCFWGIYAVALLRIAGELPGVPGFVNALAAVLGVIVLAVWTVRYLPLLFLPRADGEEG